MDLQGFYTDFIGIMNGDFMAGWWFQPTPLKNDGVKVSWDDEIPNWMEKYKIHVPNHQPDGIWDYEWGFFIGISWDLW